jgi:hypothetical protein
MSLNQQQFSGYDTEAYDRVRSLHGAGRIEAVFGEHHLIAEPPWPRAAGNKRRRGYDPQVVQEVLRRAPVLHEVDPVTLHSTQPRITRAGVDYYLGGQYERTGTTFADMHDAGNRYPVVYERDDGKNLLLSGHHRGTAALLKGEPLRARLARGSWGPARGPRS